MAWCEKCDDGLRKIPSGIKVWRCPHCGGEWKEIPGGYQAEGTEKDWEDLKARRRAELMRVKEELAKKGIKNETVSCGNSDE